ncbi:ABC transporter permease [Microbacterium sp. NPDC058342]|uniref:ABC transporter permease n=1 Tax=Microbacterium sp. NPDC058342 TaxID=3346454 RepID=UPI003669BB12
MSLETSVRASDIEPGAAVALPPARARGTWRRLLSDIPLTLSAGYILLIMLLALFAPVLTAWSGWDQYTFDQTAIDPEVGGIPRGAWGGISAEHWLGVEPATGRDIFARIAFGARVSISVALAATAVTTVVGVVLGLAAGYFGGWVDAVVSRSMEFLMAFPALIFMIAILSSIPAGNRIVLLVAVISFFGWPYLARVVRSQTLSLKEKEFVESARASGASGLSIIFTEILPNLRSTVLVLAALAVPGFVATEAGLSFLGVGVVPPTPSWGQMIAEAARWYAADPVFFLVPGIFLFLLVMSFTTFGDRLGALLDRGEARA